MINVMTDDLILNSVRKIKVTNLVCQCYHNLIQQSGTNPKKIFQTLFFKVKHSMWCRVEENFVIENTAHTSTESIVRYQLMIEHFLTPISMRKMPSARLGILSSHIANIVIDYLRVTFPGYLVSWNKPPVSQISVCVTNSCRDTTTANGFLRQNHARQNDLKRPSPGSCITSGKLIWLLQFVQHFIKTLFLGYTRFTLLLP